MAMEVVLSRDSSSSRPAALACSTNESCVSRWFTCRRKHKALSLHHAELAIHLPDERRQQF